MRSSTQPWIPLTLLFALLTSAAIPRRAEAENPNWPNPSATRAEMLDPANWPDDPSYGFHLTDMGSDRGQWNLWSFVPPQVDGQLLPEDQALGVGLHADRAWQLTTGDWAVTVAVMDSGFIWNERDLANKWRLNAGELPVPEGASVHDANGDGRFNVQDYTSATGHEQPNAATITDSRVSDQNGNGFLDPQDLILIFSNGDDADGNGYVDDICGWDFLWDDNDAYDDVGNGGQGYSHGNGEAKDSCAEGNNGLGGIGVCPGCSVIPLRSSDSFVADSNHFAEATLYAVDNGVSVIQEALGSINGTSFMQAAIDYAYERGVLVVASAADETSYHHNYPGSAEKTLYVHATVFDSNPGSWVDATTFLNFNNCTNYGGHLALSTPGEGCSSEATGKSAGHAGLLYSMARQVALDPPLSANEAYQLMTLSADDIDVAGSESDATKYPSREGWDHHFGYGRNNARTTVEWIRDGLIPPEAYLASPRWFETLTGEEDLSVEGYADARRGDGTFEVILELAAGVAPAEAEFSEVGRLSGQSAALDGHLFTVPAATLAALDLPQGDGTGAHDFSATLRLTVTTQNGGQPVRGEYRKSFFVMRDPDLLPGYPRFLGPSMEASPRLVDLDGDQADELLYITSDGTIHLEGGDGQAWPGWPVKVSTLLGAAAHPTAPGFAAMADLPSASVVSAPSVGDLDGDGTLEIVVTTLDGEVHVYDLQGQERGGFPVRMNPIFSEFTGTREAADSTPTQPIEEIFVLDFGIFGSAVLHDLDGNGDLEIVAGAMDGYLYVWDQDGSDHPGFPLEVTDGDGARYQGTLERRRERIIGTPAVGDLDGDGSPEIVVGTGEVYQGGFGNAARAYAIHADGNDHPGGPFLPGWPVGLCCYADVLPYVGRGATASPVLADLDGTPGLEVILHGALSPFNVFTYEGVSILSGTSFVDGTGNSTGNLALIPLNSGSLGDLTGDDFPEYINGCISVEAAAGMSGGERAPFDHMVCAWSLDTGEFLPGFPAVVEDYQFLHNYAVGDLDADGFAESVSGSGGYLVHAFDQNGAEPAGWPKNTGGWIFATPALGDLDGDGALDVVVGTRDGWLFAWRTAGSADSIQWEGRHHDARSTSNFEIPLPTRKGLETGGGGDGGGDEKCGCDSTGDQLPGAVAALLLVLFAWRPRQRV
ncbi:MAG: S8 family serine peptidase [Deltaproteobacteria bacterium]|nr:S8 family serine peptidase [Deltaproteobacteria bacterium]